MNKLPITLGIIGGGMIGLRHLENLVADPRVKVQWLADVSKKTLEVAAQKYNLPKVTTDYQDTLADSTVDAVCICTPPAFHAEQAVAAMKAGKHIMLEKPLATCSQDVVRILDESRRHPKLMITECSARHARINPKFKAIKEIIDSGRLGKVYYVHHVAVARQKRSGIEWNPTAKWFLDRDISGGGPLFDFGVYDLSFHLGILGEPDLVSICGGFCANRLDCVEPATTRFTVEEHGAVLMEFQGGVKYFWERASNAHNSTLNETKIYGTLGGLKFGYCTWDSPEITFYYVGDGGKGKAMEEIITVDASHCKSDLAEFDRAFVDALVGEGPVPMPLDLAAKNYSIIQQVYNSAGW